MLKYSNVLLVLALAGLGTVVYLKGQSDAAYNAVHPRHVDARKYALPNLPLLPDEKCYLISFTRGTHPYYYSESFVFASADGSPPSYDRLMEIIKPVLYETESPSITNSVVIGCPRDNP